MKDSPVIGTAGLGVATGLAGTAKFLLETEEAARAYTTVCVMLSLTNWRAKFKSDRPQSP